MDPTRFPTRRSLLRWIPAAGAAAALPALAQGNSYPAGAVTVIAPFSAGGMTDIVLRRASKFVADQLGQPFLVQQRTGAAGGIGYAAIAKAPSDGYTIGEFVGNLPLLYQMQDVPFNPVKDFTFICGLTLTEIGLAVPGNSRFKTLNELLAAAKAQPDTITLGHSGQATSGDIARVEFEQQGIKFRGVPFKGVDWMQALVGGHVDAVVSSISFPAQIKAGVIRLLATFGEQRTEQYPDTPTVRESGLPILVTSPLGIMGPAGLPPAVTARLHDAYRKWATTDEFKATLDQFVLGSWLKTGAEVETWIREQSARDKAFAERAGIAFKR